MAQSSQAKGDRLQVRLDARAKRMLRRAASHRRETVSQFVLATALAEAERIIRESEVVTLSEPDWKRFYTALTRPLAPNAALRRAYARYARAGKALTRG